LGTSKRHIELPAQKLQGSFPDTIGNLTFLEILDMPNQGLYGTLPPSLFKLQELTAVKLNWNYLRFVSVPGWGSAMTSIVVVPL
jgi:hypothetical protein